jgi:glycosyltransferase involved in cell wall biosynthesis
MGVGGSMKRNILVVGPALSASGYGEHARLVMRALKAYEDNFEIFFKNINWGQTGFTINVDEERQWLEKLIIKTQEHEKHSGKYDVSVQVTIPNEWKKLAPTNIGVTAGIETTKIAPQWIEKCFSMDKIIVPSEHAKYGFDNTVVKAIHQETGQKVDLKNNTPVEVIPYPVKDIVPQEMELELSTEFNFLSVAQWGIRKNLENTVKWFVEEFKDEEVGLVLKANIRKNCLRDRRQCVAKLKKLLSSYEGRKCKVYLLHGNLSESEMMGIYTNEKIKAIATSTHGEGYGLPIFEAVYMGLPVIAPNWSGHVDFLYAPKKDKKGKVKNKPHFTKVDYDLRPVQPEAVWNGVLTADSHWCYPKEVSFKNALRHVYKSHGSALSSAKKLKEYIREEFDEQKIYEQLAVSLGLVREQEQERVVVL